MKINRNIFALLAASVLLGFWFKDYLLSESWHDGMVSVITSSWLQDASSTAAASTAKMFRLMFIVLVVFIWQQAWR